MKKTLKKFALIAGLVATVGGTASIKVEGFGHMEQQMVAPIQTIITAVATIVQQW